MNLQSLSYRIEAIDRLVEFSSNWDAWAEENDGNDIGMDSVMHHVIFDYIAGETCRQIYRSLIRRLRNDHVESTFKFRCDSPDLRRFMLMQMTREKENGVLFSTSVLKVESRPIVSMLDYRVPRNQQVLTICSLCQKVKTSSEKWLEIEELIADQEMFQQEP